MVIFYLPKSNIIEIDNFQTQYKIGIDINDFEEENFPDIEKVKK